MNSTFQLRSVTLDEITKLLKEINVNKAHGLDEILCRLIKEAAPENAQSLCDLFNKSIDMGIFPKEWKKAKVTSVHKGKEKFEQSNYRPILVIPIISKMFEKLVFNQLYSYLSIIKIAHNHQSGFRPFHSTVMALLDATNEWYTNIDNGFLNTVVFLDLTKAFDTVDHKILFSKLELYGIKGDSLKWFESYLSFREQNCRMNGYTSKSREITCGVPQSSILGPLLFQIYINDLPSCLKHANPRMYADDTNPTITGESVSDIEEKLKHDLKNLKLWLLANRLSLNIAKTEYMLAGSRYRVENTIFAPNLRICSSSVKRVHTSKSHGIWIDENLTWSSQIDAIAKKISSAIGDLREIRSFVPQKTLITVYKALIFPLFDYCDQIWGNTSKGNLDRL